MLSEQDGVQGHRRSETPVRRLISVLISLYGREPELTDPLALHQKRTAEA